MMAETKAIPETAELTIQLGIDADKWAELEAQGWTETLIERAIEQAVMSLNSDAVIQSRAPIHDIFSVELRKYY